MRVYDNMALGCATANPEDEIDRLVREGRAYSGIDALLDRKPRQLSAANATRRDGARDRAPAEGVPVRRTLVHLDAKLACLAASEIQEAAKRPRTTSLYVTARSARGDDRSPTCWW